MRTVYWKVDPQDPETAIIQQAADMIAGGDLVAFPTETVYGLGADTFSPAAVEKIYIAKNRPPLNPLLVHVASQEQVDRIVTVVSAQARLLMERFWPGPLSIILPARPEVPGIVTANRPGVGLRMPSHPVALALISTAGPIAAPSANLSGRPSPTTAQHVKEDLDERIAGILDAGATGLGIESTVLDLTGSRPQLIRLGGVARELLEETIGEEVIITEALTNQLPHYQSKSLVILADNDRQMEELVSRYRQQGKQVAVVHNQQRIAHRIKGVPSFDLDLDQSGTELYSILRDTSKNHIDVLIFAPLPPNPTGMAAAMADRITRASHKPD